MLMDLATPSRTARAPVRFHRFAPDVLRVLFWLHPTINNFAKQFISVRTLLK